MEKYKGYVIKRINKGLDGTPTTMDLEKPNPDRDNYFPPESKTVDVSEFLKETEGLEGVLSMRKQIQILFPKLVINRCSNSKRLLYSFSNL